MTISWQQLWFRVTRMGAVFFSAMVICGVALLFLPLFHQRVGLQTELERLDQEIARQDQLERKQKTEIDGLRSDARFIERTTRDKLNLVKPAETIFRFEPAPVGAP